MTNIAACRVDNNFAAAAAVARWRGGVARRSVSLAGFLTGTRRPGATLHGLHDRAFPVGGAGGGGFDHRAAGGPAADPAQVAWAAGYLRMVRAAGPTIPTAGKEPY